MIVSRVAIIANGNLDSTFLSEIRRADYIIGVDRGAYWLIQNNINPDVAIGDFDSVNSIELRMIKRKIKRVEAYPKEKDCTDMELAVNYAISLHPKEVIIYGAICGRFDHALAAVQLLTKILAKQIHAVIRDEQNEMFLVSKNQSIPRFRKYKYLSILPFGKKVTISLRGFKYEVSTRTIIQGSTLGVSNEITSESGIIDIHNGVAVVIYSRDR